jgi:hypothetical protein
LRHDWELAPILFFFTASATKSGYGIGSADWAQAICVARKNRERQDCDSNFAKGRWIVNA